MDQMTAVKEQKTLGDFADKVPKALIELGREYKSAQLAESKAKEKTKNKMAQIIEKMHKLGCGRFRLEVNGVMKWLCLTDKEGLRWEKSETNGQVEETDE
jgi:hypothetical protein